MMKMKECRNNVPCRDCTDTSCLFHGDISRDCPKSSCDRPYGYGFLECEHCAFIDKYIDDVYYWQKENSQ